MPIGNQTFLDLELCEEAVTVQSNQVETDIIDLTIVKSASCNVALVGGKICYKVTITNNSDVDLEYIMFRDPLAPNLTYIEGSFEVDGTPQTPTIVGNELQYELTIPAIEEDEPPVPVVITFCVTVDSAA